MAALDASSQVENLSFSSGVGELRRRLEVLIGEKPEAPVDESRREEVVRETVRKRRPSAGRAGRRVVDTALALWRRLIARKPKVEPAARARETAGVPESTQSREAAEAPETVRDAETARYMEILSKGLRRKRDGTLEVTIRLEDHEALEKLARSLSAAGRPQTEERPQEETRR